MGTRWVLLLALAIGSTLGCRPSRASQSAPHVGCEPSEVTISEETVASDGYWSGSENWVAECMGRRFKCTENMQRGSTTVAKGEHLITKDSNVSCDAE